MEQIRSLWQWLNRDSVLYWALGAALVAIVLIGLVQRRASLSCSIGWTTCVFSQGKMIPSNTVVKMLDSCDDFTRQEIGRTALGLSVSEILERNDTYEKATGQAVSPLFRAHYAWKELYESPLDFDRNLTTASPAEQYSQIKRACRELHRDFNDRTKWTR
jgi:hypothetical protein